MQLQHSNKMFLYKCSLVHFVLFHLFSSIYGIYKGDMQKEPVPYAAAVKEDLMHGYYLCSGAIIAPNWVLSHTSCLLKLRGKVVVVVASTNVKYPGLVSDIKDVVINEHYDPVADIKNIALVQTMIKIVGATTSPVKITEKEWSKPSGCKLVGFGQASYNDKLIAKRNVTYGILHTGDATGFSYKGKCGCLEDKIFNKTQKEDYICNLEGKGRICIGDFGGPIVCGSGGSEEVVAVAHNFIPCKDYKGFDEYMDKETHKGTPCASEKTTDIYTYLYPYRKWILAKIANKANISIKIEKKANVSISHSYANCLPIISRWLLISTVYYTFYNL